MQMFLSLGVPCVYLNSTFHFYMLQKTDLNRFVFFRAVQSLIRQAMTSSSRLVGGAFLVLLLMQGGLVYQGLSYLNSITADFEFAVRDIGERSRYAQSMQVTAQNRIVLLLRMLAEPDPLNREEDARAFEQEGLAFGRSRDALRASSLDAVSEKMLAQLLVQAVTLSQHQRLVVQQLLMGLDEEAHKNLVDHQVFELQRKLVQELQLFGNQQHQMTVQLQQHALATRESGRLLLLGVGGVLFVLGLTLGVGVTQFISRFENALAQEKQRAENEARHDPLTGLLNRRGFEAALARWNDPKQTDGTPDKQHVLLLIDLDKFKPVNDVAGHEAGDVVLRRMAKLFQDETRPQDVVARLGGDEFAIVLRDMDEQSALEVAQRVRQTVHDFTFEWRDHHFKLGTSIGLVVFAAYPTADSWSKTMRQADDACYEAKHQGRNQVCIGRVTSA
jgi:diguanylate cyclase (GGDEF)-like protein